MKVLTQVSRCFWCRLGTMTRSHAPVVHVVWPRKCPAAIDGYLVTMIGKARADLFGKAFEAAIAIGNAARADNGDLQIWSSEASG